ADRARPEADGTLRREVGHVGDHPRAVHHARVSRRLNRSRMVMRSNDQPAREGAAGSPTEDVSRIVARAVLQRTDMTTNDAIDSIEAPALAAVCGGRDDQPLAVRAMTGVNACKDEKQWVACVQTQMHNYFGAVNLYGPEGEGNGLVAQRDKNPMRAPSTIFL